MATLDQQIEKELQGARKYAQDGNASIMEANLSHAQRYAQRVGQNISTQVAEIRALIKK